MNQIIPSVNHRNLDYDVSAYTTGSFRTPSKVQQFQPAQASDVLRREMLAEYQRGVQSSPSNTNNSLASVIIRSPNSSLASTSPLLHAGVSNDQRQCSANRQNQQDWYETQQQQ